MATATLPVLPSTPPPHNAFVEVRGILMLRLLSRCTNKCVFCMVDEKIHTSEDVDFREAVARIEAQDTDVRIEFFGGEPTIYPRFLDLLRLARSRGHECSIATNGRIFAGERYAREVASLDPAKIYIRTSLYGDSAELHDYYTSASGSYDQTVRGIRNIVQAGF